MGVSNGGGGGGIIYSQGTLATRPAPSPNRLYLANDPNQVELWAADAAGATWQSLQQTSSFWSCNAVNFAGYGNFAYQASRDGGTGESLFNNNGEFPGNVRVSAVGSGVRIKEGANGKQQTIGPMVAGSVVVANTSVTANSRIVPIRGPGGTNPGAWTVSAISAGVSYTVASTNAADTGSGWAIINEPG